MLEFNIRNQEISRIDNFSPAEKSVKYLIAKFNFKTDDWNGAIKRAIFQNVKSKVEKDAMLNDDSCVVPWEVLVGSSDIEVSVHGVIGAEEITTDVVAFNLNRTLQGGSASEEPTPTVYEQMLKEMQETKNIAQSVRDDADAGKFGGGTSITVDAELSEESKNAVENRVIAKEVNGLKQKDESLDKEVIALRERNAELEETIEKLQIKSTTSPSPFHHITDSANMKVVDFGMEGITEQYTGTITDEDGNVVVDDEGNEVTVPNPDYQQEIVNAGVYNEETGRYEIGCYVGNKNFSTFECKNYSTSLGAIYQQCYIPYTVIVSVTDDFPDDAGKSGWIMNIIRKDGSNTYCYINHSNNNLNLPKTIVASEDNPIVEIRYRVGTTPYPSGMGTGIQVESGTTKTPFIPHASQNITLTSPVPITKWDKLVKRDGVWGWSIWSDLLNVTDGTVGGGMHNGVFRIDLWYNIKSNLFTEGFCNKFLWDKFGKYTHGYCGVWNSGRICFAFKPSYLGITDTTNFNSNEVYQAFKDKVLSKGISICYKTSEEQAFIPLPDEEQILLNNLETYYGVTNVYNEQGCPMWLTYANDTKLYVDKKLLEIQQAII